METQTPFRIGGVYRNKHGAEMVICEEVQPGIVTVGFVETPEYPLYSRILIATGECERGSCDLDLIPGELTLVNGKYVPRGVPVEAPKQAQGEKVWRPHPAVYAPALPTKERTRPALPWADSKRVDRFPGFVVERSAVKHDEYNPPERVLHPLQRIAQEGDQLHGSAFLRKG